MYVGDFALESTLDFKFTTRSFSTGAPTTLAGTPSVAAYPGNSTTEVTAGITLTVDFDTRTGLHNVRIVATAANGYAADTNYSVVITAGTVGGVSVVGEVVGHFSISARSALRPTVAGRTLDVSTGGEAGVDWANVGSPTTTLNLSGTTVKTATDVETDTADIQSRLPAALVGGRIDANMGAISADATAADNAESFFDGTGYAGTNNVIPSVTTVTGNVNGSVGSVTGNVGGIAGTIQTLDALDTAQDTQHATTQGLIGTPSDFGSGTSTLAANLQDIADNGTATFDRSTDSLQAIRDRGDAAWTTGAGGTVPQLLQNTTIATLASQTSFTLTAGSADNDAYNGAIIVITDQATAEQKAVGSISDYVGSTKTVTLSADPGIFTMAVGDAVNIIAALGSGPSAADIRSEIDANSTQLAAIVADTNELQADWANGGRLDLIVDAILADTNELQADDTPGALSAISAAIAAIDTVVDAILADTGTDGVVISAATANQIADAFLDRDMSTGTDSGSTTVRTPRQALRYLRNKVSVAGTTLTVTKEDDSTTSWSATLTTDAAAEPITAIDPAGP